MNKEFTCKTCPHWSGDHDDITGQCSKSGGNPEDDRDDAPVGGMIVVTGEYFVELTTHKDFGCLLHDAIVQAKRVKEGIIARAVKQT